MKVSFSCRRTHPMLGRRHICRQRRQQKRHFCRLSEIGGIMCCCPEITVTLYLTPKGRSALCGRSALKDARIITLHVPKEYPDLSLSWIIAEDLISEQLGQRKIVPWVIEGASLKRPRTGFAELIGPRIRKLSESPIVQNVIIIDDFDFGSKSRLAFLRQEIDAWPEAKFVIVTRSRAKRRPRERIHKKHSVLYCAGLRCFIYRNLLFSAEKF